MAWLCPQASAGEPVRAEDSPPVASAEAPREEGLPEAEGVANIPHIPDPLFDEDFDDFDLGPPAYDPLEPANRAVFRFNQRLDDWVFDPVTRGYRWIAPEPVRRGIYRAFDNLNTPVYVVNNVLQLRFVAAAETVAAFALNSTLGVVGFLEPSREADLALRAADFGQTLQSVGIGPGPYLVIPVLGPSTVRDGVGSAVDLFLQPLTYVLGLPIQLVWGGSAGLSLRDEVSDELAALEASSVDFYAALRSAYLQSRQQSLERVLQDDPGVRAPSAEPDQD